MRRLHHDSTYSQNPQKKEYPQQKSAKPNNNKFRTKPNVFSPPQNNGCNSRYTLYIQILPVSSQSSIQVTAWSKLDRKFWAHNMHHIARVLKGSNLSQPKINDGSTFNNKGIHKLFQVCSHFPDSEVLTRISVTQ